MTPAAGSWGPALAEREFREACDAVRRTAEALAADAVGQQIDALHDALAQAAADHAALAARAERAIETLDAIARHWPTSGAPQGMARAALREIRGG